MQSRSAHRLTPLSPRPLPIGQQAARARLPLPRLPLLPPSLPLRAPTLALLNTPQGLSTIGGFILGFWGALKIF
jgi:hypothetical protein